MPITMGNDEFILYIRKQHPSCTVANPTLGHLIWVWLQQADPNAQLIGRAPTYWGATGAFVSATKLPETATQFRFDRAVLPDLYTYLDTLGTGEPST